MKTLKDKVIVITGASSGIGEAMARTYAAQGAKVVLGARSVEKLQRLADEIRTAGGQAAFCGVDVVSEEECRKLIDTAVEAFGRIDVLICNAGISMRAIFDDVDLSVLHRLMDVNFWGTVNCCKYALPYLQASRGSVVGISSVAGLHGLPGRTGYSASKYAMTGFLETLRIEKERHQSCLLCGQRADRGGEKGALSLCGAFRDRAGSTAQGIGDLSVSVQHCGAGL